MCYDRIVLSFVIVSLWKLGAGMEVVIGWVLNMRRRFWNVCFHTIQNTTRKLDVVLTTSRYVVLENGPDKLLYLLSSKNVESYRNSMHKLCLFIWLVWELTFCIILQVGLHPEFENSRCLFIVRKDGEQIDFSFWKCVKGFIRQKYPMYADSFILRHFRRRQDYWSSCSYGCFSVIFIWFWFCPGL